MTISELRHLFEPRDPASAGMMRVTWKSAWLLPAFAVAAISMSPAAVAQSARPPIDYNASVEAARSLRSNGPHFVPINERFELFNDCELVTVRVGVLDIGLDSNASVETDLFRMRSTAE